MKVYTVLEVRHIGDDSDSHEFDELNGWSTSYPTRDEAFERLEDVVCDAVNLYYEGSDVEDSVKANIISGILTGMDGGRSMTSWDTSDYHYIWKINEDEVDDPDPKTQELAKSENKDEPAKPEEAKIGFMLKDKVTYEVYTYKFRQPAMAAAFAESIRRVMESTTTPVGVFVWNPMRGLRSVDDAISGMTWDDLLNELRLAATPNSEFERTEVGAEMLSRRNRKYPEFYPDNVWSVLLKHTSTLVVNVKAKTLDEAIEKVKAKGDTNDWFADPDIWAWDSDGESVEIDRESCHAAPGEEEDF